MEITSGTGGWFVRAGDGFWMDAHDSRSMRASFIAESPSSGVQPMHVEANFSAWRTAHRQPLPAADVGSAARAFPRPHALRPQIPVSRPAWWLSWEIPPQARLPAAPGRAVRQAG